MIANFFQHITRYFGMLRMMIAKPENNSMYIKEIFRQMYEIGVGSLVIVTILTLFLGAVTAVQFVVQMDDLFIPLYWVGYIIRDAMIIELAPTMACLVLAGKVGSNMASEIGGMRQKEQIDALEIMGVNTAAYLVLPKIIAAILVVPLLVTLAAFVGITGGLLGSIYTGKMSIAEYDYGLRNFFVEWNFFLMYVKAVVFAFILTSVSCYQGYFVKGGSIELGEASTRAVVLSNIAILIADLLIAIVMT